MSWMHSRSQREDSPQPAPCSLSQMPQGSASRVLGMDITNRSPTPPPPQVPSMSKTFARVSPTPPSLSNTLAWSTQQARAFSCSSRDYVDNTNDGAQSAMSFVLPSSDMFLAAMEAGGDNVEDSHRQVTRRRSRSPAATDAHVVENWSIIEAQRDQQGWQHYECTTALNAKPVQAELPAGLCPLKRARLQSDTPGSTGSSACQRDGTRLHSEYKVAENGGSLVSNLISLEKGASNVAPGDGHHLNAFFTPISTKLLLSSFPNYETVLSPIQLSSAECSSSGPYREQRSDMPVTPHSSVLATSTSSTSSSAHKGHAHLCMPARLLDTEIPSWQVMEAVSANAGESTELLSTTLQGDRRVRMVSAVDNAIVYSPGSLDDISPIVCLSGDLALLRGGASGSTDQRTPPHLQNEEARRQRMDGRGSCETSSDASVDRLLYQTYGDDEEGGKVWDTLSLYTGDASTHSGYTQSQHLREDMQRLASDGFDDLQRGLLCWQR
ncbi:hypothetical protein ABL78_6644 [Leptomonas seymouri]|uniref:Uncharacterized protein n=1 Tax=Leptomonas seymouri TaxID=5684 RepID=A0A0N1I323_LEPSE|nr:hypothetical protein ABL78_6644 [Leptomonas seymouri]|eukprot:KPI84301.1 hypothetical protein ABL78_6644 [Leptomonas seymouri]